MLKREWTNTFEVYGLSMLPFILPGSRIRVERVPIEQIRRGDLICYIGSSKKCTAHRVIGKIESPSDVTLITRGDAQICEELVPEDAMIFFVSRVEHRIFSYHTDGLVGKLFARIALSESSKILVLKALLRKTATAIYTIARL